MGCSVCVLVCASVCACVCASWHIAARHGTGLHVRCRPVVLACAGEEVVLRFSGIEPVTGPSVAVSVTMLPCPVGTERVGHGVQSTCFECIPGTYSVTSDAPCLPCPDKGLCYGGALVVPRAGMFRTVLADQVEIVPCRAIADCGGQTAPAAQRVVAEWVRGVLEWVCLCRVCASQCLLFLLLCGYVCAAIGQPQQR